MDVIKKYDNIILNFPKLLQNIRLGCFSYGGFLFLVGKGRLCPPLFNPNLGLVRDIKS